MNVIKIRARGFALLSVFLCFGASMTSYAASEAIIVVKGNDGNPTPISPDPDSDQSRNTTMTPQSSTQILVQPSPSYQPGMQMTAAVDVHCKNNDSTTRYAITNIGYGNADDEWMMMQHSRPCAYNNGIATCTFDPPLGC